MEKAEAPKGHALERAGFAPALLPVCRTRPERAIRDLKSILENIVNHLSNADGGDVELMLEVKPSAEAFEEHVQRMVRENRITARPRGGGI